MSLPIIAKIFDFLDFSTDVDNDLEQELFEAREEWNNARKYFNSVSDPDLIDHAIYLLEAAESKYTYLLKKKKTINEG